MRIPPFSFGIDPHAQMWTVAPAFCGKNATGRVMTAGEAITESSERPGVQSSLAIGEEEWKAWQVDPSRRLCMKL